MSLTSLLKDPNSSVSLFMKQHFPNTRRLMTEWNPLLKNRPTIRPSERVPYGTIGTALDYRLRYFFGITPHNQLVAFRGAALLCGARRTIDAGTMDISYDFDSTEAQDAPVAGRAILDFFSQLDETLSKIDPVGKMLDTTAEQEISRYCIALALLEEIRRAGVGIRSPLLDPPIKSAVDLLAIAEDHWIDDLCELSVAFVQTQPNLLEGTAKLNPTFDGSRDVGGADADLIVDSCLIDVKATVNPRVATEWIYQLTGYLLLDYSNRHGMKAVGLYMARQGLLLEVEVPRFLQLISDGSTSELEELRSFFQHAVAA